MLTTGAGHSPDLRWFSRLTVVAALTLIAVTWRLWVPQSRFPQIPLFAAAGRLPLWVEWAAGLTMIAALFTALLCNSTSRAGRTALLLFIASTMVLVVIDQHRLQTWTWQFILIAWILATASDRQAVGLLQWLMASIYFYSAVSKLDVGFFTGEGQQILDGLLRSIGLSISGWPEPVRRIVTAGMPVGELLVAVGLCLRKTRRTALVAAVIMHMALCLALGPWGLNHKPGVLIWNVCFLTQVLLLFARRSRMPSLLIVFGWPGREDKVRSPGISFASLSPTPATPQIRDGTRRSSRPAEVALLAAMLLPLLEPFGWFDQWPAWGLYASAPQRMAVFIHCSQRGHLPEPIQRHVEYPPPLHSWCRLRIDRWSLDALGVPLYPQNRFRTGVALAVAQRYHLGSAIRVIVESAAHRWTGRRTERIIAGEADLREFSDEFLLNARPRSASVGH